MYDLKLHDKLTAWPNWVNLKTRKSAFANSKNQPGIDYKEVAYTPEVEEKIVKEATHAAEASN